MKKFAFLFLLVLTAIPIACLRPLSSPPTSPLPAPTATPTPTAMITFTPTPSLTAGPWDVTAANSVTLQPGEQYVGSYIHLHSGATLTLPANARVYFEASDYFTMDSGSTIICLPVTTETAGSPSLGTSSAGAGHGGAGGSDGLGNAGGAAYDSSSFFPSLPGSPGAAGACTGGGGGAYISILAVGSIGSGAATLNGVINVNGFASNNCSATAPLSPSGAGSGGAIYISARSIQGTGWLTAQGGTGLPDTGGANNAGGGGGGIIFFVSPAPNYFTGTISVQGGTATAPAQPGQNGIFNFMN